MCVALPGKVLEVRKDKAVCDFNGNLVEARTGLVDVKPGDYVLVHAGCILQKVSEGQAMDLQQLMQEVEAF